VAVPINNLLLLKAKLLRKQIILLTQDPYLLQLCTYFKHQLLISSEHCHLKACPIYKQAIRKSVKTFHWSPFGLDRNFLKSVFINLDRLSTTSLSGP